MPRSLGKDAWPQRAARRDSSGARTPASERGARLLTRAVWLDNVARVECRGVPLALAYSMWEDKAGAPFLSLSRLLRALTQPLTPCGQAFLRGCPG